MKEYDAYRAVYCGLCRQMGRSFGPFARLLLSYDFAFLAMMSYATGSDTPEVSVQRCCVNPLNRVPMCSQDDTLSYASDIALLMLYYKLLDNIRDGGFWGRAGSRILQPVAAAARKQAMARRPEEDIILARLTEQQRAVEETPGGGIDRAAEPTAAAMAALCARLSGDTAQTRVLERLGYLLGRYIYLCDAMDDLDKDKKSGNFNPLLHPDSDTPERAREKACESLYLTIAEAEKASALLTLRVFAPVIRNVIELGLRNKVDDILSKKEKAR